MFRSHGSHPSVLESPAFQAHSIDLEGAPKVQHKQEDIHDNNQPLSNVMRRKKTHSVPTSLYGEFPLYVVRTAKQHSKGVWVVGQGGGCFIQSGLHYSEAELYLSMYFVFFPPFCRTCCPIFRCYSSELQASLNIDMFIQHYCRVEWMFYRRSNHTEAYWLLFWFLWKPNHTKQNIHIQKWTDVYIYFLYGILNLFVLKRWQTFNVSQTLDITWALRWGCKQVVHVSLQVPQCVFPFPQDRMFSTW